MPSPKYDLSDPDALFFCPTCGSGYTAKATRCVDCDELLVPRSWVESQMHEQSQQHDTGEAVRLCRVVDRFEANFLKEELDTAGIPFMVKELDVQASLLSGAVAGNFDFFVTEHDLPRALDLVHRLEVPEPESEDDE